jgi:hypothetical protein
MEPGRSPSTATFQPANNEIGLGSSEDRGDAEVPLVYWTGTLAIADAVDLEANGAPPVHIIGEPGRDDKMCRAFRWPGWGQSDPTYSVEAAAGGHNVSVSDTPGMTWTRSGGIHFGSGGSGSTGSQG